jgi:hypothetical protein
MSENKLDTVSIEDGVVGDLFAALAKAQGEMSNAPFDATNPHFKSKYATLASIRDATVPHLAKYGLSIHQITKLNGDGMVLATRLGHSSGQWIESVYPLPNSNKPHEMGSAITYARRYSWAAICGVAAEEDDDANAANDAAKNGTKSLPALPARKSSAAAKRDGDWPRFEAALRDCQSAREVEKLRAEYQAQQYHAWNSDWRDTAEQEFAKRQAEFSTGEDLKQTLQDSLEEESDTGRAHLRNEMIESIQKMGTEEDLLMWKESPAFRRDLAILPHEMQLAVRKAGATKLKTLQMVGQ